MKGKKILAVLLSVAVIYCAVPFGKLTAKANTSGNLTYTISNGEIIITGCDKTILGDLIIPENIDGYLVTKIGHRAFADCKSITSIKIPPSIKGIDVWAFDGSNSIESVYILDLETWCEIYFPTFEESASNPLRGADLYVNNKLVTDLVIPKSMTSINNWTFQGCRSITSVSFQNEITSIGDGSFWNCDALTSITLPNGVTSIGNWAFYHCNSLASITIPDSVTSIGSCAFYHCDSLSSITIPETVTNIGSSAFKGCDKLVANVYENSVAYDYVIEENIPFNIIGSAIKGTFNGVEWKYEKEKGRLSFIGEGVLPDISFYTDVPWYGYVDEIHDIRIGDGITYIGENVFSKMSALKKVELPESVEKIGTSAFADCRNLEEINLNANIKEIPEKAFYNCLSLKNLGDTSGILSISDNAFYRCTSLESVEFENTGYIGNFVFYKCTALNNVKLSEKINNIGECAFGKCSALKRIYLPENMNAFDPDAFADCNVTITHNPEIVEGDIDCDGTVSATDITIVRKALLYNTSSGLECDINGDGTLNIKDLVCIKKLTVT